MEPKLNLPEKKVADDAPQKFTPDYEFMDQNQQPDLSFDQPSKQVPAPADKVNLVDAMDPEKELFKKFLVGIRDGLRSTLDAESNYKKLNLYTLFPEGDVGTGVYLLNVAEVRDRLQKSAALLSDVFNALASISDNPQEQQNSGFFTDEGYTAGTHPISRDTVGDALHQEEDSDPVTF